MTATQQLQRSVINVAFHRPPLDTDPSCRLRSRSERLISSRCSVQTEFPLRPAKVWSYSGDIRARYWTPPVLLENKTLKSKMCQAWPESLSAPPGRQQDASISPAEVVTFSLTARQAELSSNKNTFTLHAAGQRLAALQHSSRTYSERSGRFIRSAGLTMASTK